MRTVPLTVSDSKLCDSGCADDIVLLNEDPSKLHDSLDRLKNSISRPEMFCIFKVRIVVARPD